MAALLDFWIFFCGVAGVLIAWFESAKGPQQRILMAIGAWVVVVLSMAHLMVRVAQSEEIIRENQALLRQIMERLQ